MQSVALLGVATLALVQALAAPPKEEGVRKKEKPRADIATYENLALHNYDDLSLDNYGEIIDLSIYEELYDYDDLEPKVRGRQQSIRNMDQIFSMHRWGVLGHLLSLGSQGSFCATTLADQGVPPAPCTVQGWGILATLPPSAVGGRKGFHLGFKSLAVIQPHCSPLRSVTLFS